MTSLLAARRKNFAATFGFHTRTKSVRFGAAAFPRLKCTLWQNNPPYDPDTARELPKFHPPAAFCRLFTQRTRMALGSCSLSRTV
jgi:hypothetical protein